MLKIRDGGSMMNIMKLVLSITIFYTLAGANMAQNPEQVLDNLAHSVYQTIWQASPINATYKGFHKYDGELGKYSPADIQAQIQKLNRFLDELRTINITDLSEDGQIDYELLASDIRMQIFYLDQIRGWEKNPYEYADECLSGVYTLLRTDFAPLEERAQNISHRLAYIPALLKQAKKNIKNPPKTFAIAAIETFKTGEEFIDQVAENLAGQFPLLKKEMLGNRKKAVNAMRDYRVHLEKILPTLNDDFAIGKDNFNYMLKNRYRLAYDADSILKIGEQVLISTNMKIQELRKQKAEYDSLHAKSAEPKSAPPPDFSAQDILRGIDNTIESLRVWTVQNQFATVPDYVGTINAVKTPDFLKVVIPGLAMQPPAPLDSIQNSAVYIPYIPDSMDDKTKQVFFDNLRYKRWTGGMLHECFPGHFLQLSIANHHPSFIRKIHQNTLMVEGWALYCEQMCAENGLYPNDGFLELKWLGGVRFRAARIILDVSLQTGRMTYDDAWRYLVKILEWDPTYAQNEVRRYTMTPTQPLSYLTGKLELLKLRDAYQKKMGDKYSLKDFHDKFLAEGSIPISLISRKMLRE
jgi:uncharacterized protein (DUF885 family)